MSEATRVPAPLTDGELHRLATVLPARRQMAQLLGERNDDQLLELVERLAFHERVRRQAYTERRGRGAGWGR